MKKFIGKIRLILTTDCELSARFTSDSLDRNLDWSERWAQRLHNMICAKSRRLHRQLTHLETAFDSTNENPELETKLSDQSKERIRNNLANLDTDETAS